MARVMEVIIQGKVRSADVRRSENSPDALLRTTCRPF